MGPRPGGTSVRRLRRGEAYRTAFARGVTKYNPRSTGGACAGGDTSTAGSAAAGGRCCPRLESQCIMRASAL